MTPASTAPTVPLSAVALLVALVGGPAAGCVSTHAARRAESLAGSLARADREFEARRYGAALASYRLVAFGAGDAEDAGVFVEAASQCASVLALQDLPSEAAPWLARAAERAAPTAPGGWSRFLLARGLVAWKEGRAPEALASFSELHSFCSQHGPIERAIQATQMAALVTTGAEQIDWARRGIEAAAKAGKPEWEGPLWANLGWLLDARDLRAEALQAFERALELARRGELTRIGLARFEWAHAHALLRGGRTAEARRALEALFEVLATLYARERTPVVAEYFGRTLVDLAELDAASGVTPRAIERLRAARARFVEAGAVEAAPELIRRVDERLASLDGVGH